MTTQTRPSGRLIFISGLSGAGKSTLLEAALANIPELEYLRTTTTRPRRDGEDGSLYYDFVTKNEYEAKRQNSKQWDHSEFGGNYYGSDVEEMRAKLQDGTSIICSVAPVRSVITPMTTLYGTATTTVWINTDRHVCIGRISDDPTRLKRLEESEDESLRTEFDIVFTPKNKLNEDREAFVELITKLTSVL